MQDRLDAINDPIVVPDVNDENSNGIDDADTAAEAAAELVKDAEDLQLAAEDLLEELQADGLITPDEQSQLQDAADAAAEARAEAEAAVNDLAAGGVRDALEDRLDAINDPITVPPVNDADANGVEDTAAEQAATALVEDAEAAQEAAEELLAELQEDGLITPAEQAQLQAAADAAAEARAEAEAAVNDLAAGGVRDALEDRLDAINDPITVPPVNDADANGVEDTAAEQAATALVEDAEAAQEAAEELLAELQEDGLITPAEQAQLQAAADAAAEARAEAEAAVNDLAAGGVRDALEDRLDAINDPITVPPVNDADANGVDDVIEAEGAVVAAEALYAEKQADLYELADANGNGVITPEEYETALVELQDELAIAQAEVDQARETARDLVDLLPAGEIKSDLQSRLDNLDLAIPAVNDADDDGIPDNFDAIAVDDQRDVEVNVSPIITANVAQGSGTVVATVGLVELDLNVLGRPVVSFNVQEGHEQDVTFNVTTLLDLSLFGNPTIILQKLENGVWTSVDSSAQGATLINLDILTDGFRATAEGLDAGEYRVYLASTSVLTVSLLTRVTATATDYDYTQIGSVTASEIQGNVFEDTNYLAGKDTITVNTKVIRIEVNGETIEIPENESVTILGNYGQLVISSSGQYTYTLTTPNVSDIGQQDVFIYTISDRNDTDPSNNTANLTFNIISPDISGNVNAQDDNFDIDVNISKQIDFIDHELVSTAQAARSTQLTEASDSITFILGDLNNGVIQISSGYVATAGANTTVTYTLYRDDVPVEGYTNLSKTASHTLGVIAAETLATINLSDPNLLPGNYRLEYTVTKAARSTITGAATSAAPVTITLDGSSFVIGENTDASKSQSIVTGNLYADNGLGADSLDGYATKLKFGATQISLNETTIIETAQGTLIVSGNGDYIYTAKPVSNVNSITPDQIEYELVSPNGATNTATVSFNPIINTEGTVAISTTENDVFNTGTGADTVIYDLLSGSALTSTNAGNNTSISGNDVWADYNFNEGDTLDLRGLFKELDEGTITTENVGGYIRLEQDGNNVKVSVDLDGPNLVGGSIYTGLIILNNTNVTLQDLLENNQIIY